MDGRRNGPERERRVIDIGGGRREGRGFFAVLDIHWEVVVIWCVCVCVDPPPNIFSTTQIYRCRIGSLLLLMLLLMLSMITFMMRCC